MTTISNVVGTWRQLDVLNQSIYEAHRHQSLDEVIADFRATHQRFLKLIEAMPEDEMMEQGRYAFIGKGAAYDWLSAYAAHDVWGKIQIRKWMKARQRPEGRPAGLNNGR